MLRERIVVMENVVVSDCKSESEVDGLLERRLTLAVIVKVVIHSPCQRRVHGKADVKKGNNVEGNKKQEK
jgi:hypothetical protein